MARQSVRTPEEHLRQADRILGRIIDAVVREGGDIATLEPDPTRPPDPDIPSDHYAMLVRAIVV
ncbi:hypothetical protein ACWCQN_33385 [Streptomyces sp. NPDC001984]|uniref:hypothetical protein n=1 Tax=Streptomyces sp. NPDC002619 TaxID=3364655 RepID=UPI0036CD2278